MKSISKKSYDIILIARGFSLYANPLATDEFFLTVSSKCDFMPGSEVFQLVMKGGTKLHKLSFQNSLVEGKAVHFSKRGWT